MFRLCTGVKEKASGSGSRVLDADRPSDRGDTEERRPYPSVSDQAILEQRRDRILDIAEKCIRRVGHRKTTIADIASDLGTSRANVYRFFPTKAAIDNSVFARIAKEVAEVALSITRTDAAASKMLVEFLNVLYRHSRRTLMEERPVHELFVAAMDENWATMNAHNERIRAILEAIIRKGLQAGEFQVEDAGRATRGVMTAFLPFFHPVLVEQGVQEGKDMAVAAYAQIRFIMQALGKSDWRRADTSEVMISA